MSRCRAARSSGERAELGYRGSACPGGGGTQQEPGRGLRFARGERPVTVELRETGRGGGLGQDAGHRRGQSEGCEGVEPE